MESVPKTVCNECGKPIGPRAQPHLVKGATVCSSCRRKLTAPPTDFQIEEAQRRRVKYPADTTRVELAALLSQRAARELARTMSRDARAVGLVVLPGESLEELERRVRQREITYAWTLSVCRHLAGAEWLRHGDAQVVAQHIYGACEEIEANPTLLQQVKDFRSGPMPYSWEFENACIDAGIESYDYWHFFGGDQGLDPTLPAYQETQAIIVRHAQG